MLAKISTAIPSGEQDGATLPSPTLTNPEMILPYGDDSDDTHTGNEDTHSAGLSLNLGFPTHRLVSTGHGPPSPTQLLRKVHARALVVQVAEPIDVATSARSSLQTAVSGAAFSPTGIPGLEPTGPTPHGMPSSYFSNVSPTAVDPRHFPTAVNDTDVPARNRRRSQVSLAGSEISSSDRIRHANSPGRSELDAENADEDWLGAAEDMNGDTIATDEFTDDDGTRVGDRLSHATLSRRAELILENAKKKLLLMEGNLRGARYSLLISPSPSLNSLRAAAENSGQEPQAMESRSALGTGSTTNMPYRSYSSAGLAVKQASRHTRGYSDSSSIRAVPVNSPGHSLAGQNAVQRSYIDFSKPSNFGISKTNSNGPPRHPRVRSSRSQELMSDSRLSSWGLSHQNRSEDGNGMDTALAAANAANAKTAENGYALAEHQQSSQPDEDEFGAMQEKVARTATDLKAQMSELKGRISSLRQRSREEGMKRRSQQSLRTPTPFTEAETWYTGTESYRTGALGTDAGVGLRLSSSPQLDAEKLLGEERHSPGEDTRGFPEPQASADLGVELGSEPGPTVHSQNEVGSGFRYPGNTEDFLFEDTQTDFFTSEVEAEDVLNDYSPDHQDETMQADFSLEDDTVDDDATVYEEAVTSLGPVAERHEDRLDAFDYEHFFLHSAMGSYSQLNRSPSLGSSADSVQTARLIDQGQDEDPEQQKLTQQRHRKEPQLGAGEYDYQDSEYAMDPSPVRDTEAAEEEAEGELYDAVADELEPTHMRGPFHSQASVASRYHQRNMSVSSLSSQTTVASFATAVEGQATSPSSPVPVTVTTPKASTQAPAQRHHRQVPSTTSSSRPSPTRSPTNRLRSPGPHIASQLSGRSIGSVHPPTSTPPITVPSPTITTVMDASAPTTRLPTSLITKPLPPPPNLLPAPQPRRPRPVSTVVSTLLDTNPSWSAFTSPPDATPDHANGAVNDTSPNSAGNGPHAVASRRQQTSPYKQYYLQQQQQQQLAHSSKTTGSRMPLSSTDKALVYSLAESLRLACQRLQHSISAEKDAWPVGPSMAGRSGNGSVGAQGIGIQNDDFDLEHGRESEVWRQRLLRARMALDGEA